MAALPTVSFVVPTFKRPDALAQTLGALQEVEYPSELREVIVVDNADDQATARVVESKANGPLAIRYEVQHKPGAAAARNHGADVARGELLVFCDDDILVEPSHLELQLETRQRLGDCLVNGDWYFSPASIAALRESPFGRYRLALEEHFRRAAPEADSLGDGCWEVRALSACNLAISKERFWNLGGFDEAFPFAGAEDREFSVRAARGGARLVRNDRIGLLHNDQTISFEQFCTREERSAQTVGVLAGGDAASEYARFIELNGRLARGDAPAIAFKKVVKTALVFPPVLRSVHWMVSAAERLGLPDRILARAYSAVVGLHIQRGFRESR